MPGAWELSGPDVLVVILTRELVTTRWAASLRSINLPANSEIRLLAGMPYDHARNVGCKEALVRGFQWVFFLDDDVVMPPDGIHILKSNKMPIISGLYYRRHEPVTPVALMNTPDGKGRQWIAGYQPGTLFPADYIGAGCLLIHRTVLEKMPSPWFEWWTDREDLPENERMSEDFAFCHKAKTKYGYELYVDTRVSCLHAGLAAAGPPGKMSPLALA